MAIRVVESETPAELGMTTQWEKLNEPTVIKPKQVWDQLTSYQQHQVAHSLVQVGRQLVQQVMKKEEGDERK